MKKLRGFKNVFLVVLPGHLGFKKDSIHYVIQKTNKKSQDLRVPLLEKLVQFPLYLQYIQFVLDIVAIYFPKKIKTKKNLINCH